MPEMTAAEAAEWGKTLSFETVWAALKETDRLCKENAERFKELERLMKENAEREAERQAKFDIKFDKISENVGGLNRSLGALIETLIAARLWEKFPEYGLKRAYQRIPIYDEKSEMKTDIDILLVNTTMCMAVEVKHELVQEKDVKRHIKRMQLIRKYPPEQIGNKQLVAAMAGGVVDPDVKDYAYNAGFYVLELTGESVHLIPPPKNFKPKKW